MGEWLARVAVKKALVRVAQGAAALAVAKGADPALQKVGVSIHVDPDVLAGAILGASEVARSWLKAHFPRACGWL